MVNRMVAPDSIDDFMSAPFTRASLGRGPGFRVLREEKEVIEEYEKAQRGKKKGRALAVSLLLMGIAYGCASPKRSEPAAASETAPMPPLPQAAMQSAGPMSALAISPPAPQRRVITFAWDNEPSASAAAWETGVQATTDFVTWKEVACIPYTTNPVVTITNDAPMAFYRAFNRIAEMPVKKVELSP